MHNTAAVTTSSICVASGCSPGGPEFPARITKATWIDLNDGRVVFVGGEVDLVANKHTW